MAISIHSGTMTCRGPDNTIKEDVMRTENESVVQICLTAKTQFAFDFKCVIDGPKPTAEELQSLAHLFADDVDYDNFEEIEGAWKVACAEAELIETPQLQPLYRARLVDGVWDIEEVRQAS
jgi:hypothetical protein